MAFSSATIFVFGQTGMMYLQTLWWSSE